jgi:hypothetical protein
MELRVLGILVSALGAAAFAFAPAAQAARTVNLSLLISFYSNGTVSVTAPDGSPIGTTSGSPTVVPAGYYSLVFSGPGGCFTLPTFHLTGPAVNIVSNMTEAQGQKNASGIDLLPGSTYLWSVDTAPGVVHTFVTSAQVEGSPPSAALSGGSSSGRGKPVTSQDIVGSAVAPSRGTLTAAVNVAGKLSVAYRGRSFSSLRAGKYTIVVTDDSSSHGFVLQKLPRSARTISGPGFTGKRKVSVNLTAGKWLFTDGAGKTTRAVVVS